MTHDTFLRLVELREGGEERGGKLRGDVAVHFVVAGVGGCGGIDVETGACAEVPGFVFASYVQSACERGVSAGGLRGFLIICL